MSKKTDSADRRFLRLIRDDIRTDALKEFRQQCSAFTWPNNFPFGKLEKPLSKCEFPEDEFFEFCWAINECAQVSRGAPLAVYLSAVYLFCDSQQPSGLQVSDEYIRHALVGLNEIGKPNLTRAFLEFLEWLLWERKVERGYDDYFILLGWLFTARLLGVELNTTMAKDIVMQIQQRKLSREAINELSDCEECSREWPVLNDTFPLPTGLDRRDFLTLIPR